MSFGLETYCSTFFGTMTYSQSKRSWWSQGKSRVFAFRRSLSRDFDYSTDFFFGLNFLMVVSGGRLNSRNVQFRVCWNIYRMLVILAAIVTLRNCFLNMANGSDFEIVLNSVQVSLGILSTVLHMALVLWHYNSLMAVRRYVNRRRFGRSLEPSLGIRRDAFYHVRKLVITVVALMCGAIASVPFQDISHHHAFKLPFEDGSSLPILQYFHGKIYLCFTVGIGFAITTVHLVPYMILTGLGAEVKVIAKSFSVIFENTDQRVQWRMEGEPCSVWQTELKMKYYFWKFVQEEIGECIDLHVEFLAMLNRVRPMLNKMFYLFYYTTALSLACAAIYLATKKSISMIFIHTLIHALLIAFEFMILTRMVSWLNEAVSIQLSS